MKGRERGKGRGGVERRGEERRGENDRGRNADMTDLAGEGEQVITVGRLDGTLIHVQDDHVICWHLMDILSAQEQKDRIKSARGKCESSPVPHSYKNLYILMELRLQTFAVSDFNSPLFTRSARDPNHRQ